LFISSSSSSRQSDYFLFLRVRRDGNAQGEEKSNRHSVVVQFEVFGNARSLTPTRAPIKTRARFTGFGMTICDVCKLYHYRTLTGQTHISRAVDELEGNGWRQTKTSPTDMYVPRTKSSPRGARFLGQGGFSVWTTPRPVPFLADSSEDYISNCRKGEQGYLQDLHPKRGLAVQFRSTQNEHQ